MNSTENPSVSCLEEEKVVIVKITTRCLGANIGDSLKELLKEIILERTEDGYKHFVLNLDMVNVCNEEGLELIIVANNFTASNNAKLHLCRVKPFIIKIFDILRITGHLSVYDTESAALEAIRTQDPD